MAAIPPTAAQQHPTTDPITSPTSKPNGTVQTPAPPVQLAFSLPTSPDTRVHLHLSNSPNSLLLFLASTSPGAASTTATVGGLVYALPNRDPSAQPLSTALYTRSTSLDFSNRLARILAARCRKPVFVGGELKFWEPEDEGLAMSAVVDAVMWSLSRAE